MAFFHKKAQIKNYQIEHGNHPHLVVTKEDGTKDYYSPDMLPFIQKTYHEEKRALTATIPHMLHIAAVLGLGIAILGIGLSMGTVLAELFTATLGIATLHISTVVIGSTIAAVSFMALLKSQHFTRQTDRHLKEVKKYQLYFQNEQLLQSINSLVLSKSSPMMPATEPIEVISKMELEEFRAFLLSVRENNPDIAKKMVLK